ncbi:MAG: alpha/beta hydrolase family protein [bacterium]
MKQFRHIFIFLYLAAVPLCAQESVTIVEDSLYSPGVQSNMKFAVLLPRNYYHVSERYTTIYLLHGFGGGYMDWIKYSGLVKYLKEYNYIVICPDAENSWYTNSFDKKKRFEDYIVSDLIPFAESKYRTLSTRHGRVVAGLSMGGYGALKFAIKYPSRFVFAASFSGALYVPYGVRPDNKNISESLMSTFGAVRSPQWTKNDPFDLLDSLKSASSLPYLYISTGKDDNLGRIVERNRALAQKLLERGAAYEYHESSGGHSWQYWDHELRNFLRRLSTFDPLNP